MFGRLAAATVLALTAVGIWFFLYQPSDEPAPLERFTLERRPQADRYLFDYAGLLEHFEEGIHRYLSTLTHSFHIESFIVTLPTLEGRPDINTLAVDIANRWAIGGATEGRGLLLLLVRDQSQVRLEVGYELEDVFTDAFVGFVEDKQLKRYFLNDDLGTGLVAVMEELERRAQLKQQGNYTPGLIARLDKELLSGGAGAKRTLTDYKTPEPRPSQPAPRSKRGVTTPDQAWRLMVAKWAGEDKNADISVYTELTKMAMGDPHKPDRSTSQSVAHWRNASYQIVKDADHAVVFFGNKKGWENAPFLFCRTQSGWKFDIVHQRRLVVMGKHPNWFVEQGRFPYVDLLRSVPQSTGKDLPLDRSDLYSCAKDAVIANRIRGLEARYKKQPGDTATVMELMRLNVITGRRPNHVVPLIKRAKQLAPNSPTPYKYAAIYNINTFFQYNTAAKEIQGYLDRDGEPVFGYNVLGFTHYRMRRYDQALDALQQALQHDPDNVYALSLMARIYGLLYRKARKRNVASAAFAEKARTYLARARSVPADDIERVDRVARWLARNGIQ